MIVEMRTYKTKPGKRAEFLEIFRTRSIPAHNEISMRILGPFLSIEDADTFFFMRGFPNLGSREPMKAKFYTRRMLASRDERRQPTSSTIFPGPFFPFRNASCATAASLSGYVAATGTVSLPASTSSTSRRRSA